MTVTLHQIHRLPDWHLLVQRMRPAATHDLGNGRRWTRNSLNQVDDPAPDLRQGCTLQQRCRSTPVSAAAETLGNHADIYCVSAATGDNLNVGPQVYDEE